MYSLPTYDRRGVGKKGTKHLPEGSSAGLAEGAENWRALAADNFKPADRAKIECAVTSSIVPQAGIPVS